MTSRPGSINVFTKCHDPSLLPYRTPVTPLSPSRCLPVAKTLSLLLLFCSPVPFSCPSRFPVAVSPVAPLLSSFCFPVAHPVATSCFLLLPVFSLMPPCRPAVAWLLPPCHSSPSPSFQLPVGSCRFTAVFLPLSCRLPVSALSSSCSHPVAFLPLPPSFDHCLLRAAKI